MACARLCEAELHSEERSKTDLALFKEALRYESASFHFGCLVSGPYSSPSSFSGRTPLGEYCDLSGDGKECDEGENSFRLLNGTESPMGETVKCWDLTEVNKGRIEELGKELCFAQTVHEKQRPGGSPAGRKVIYPSLVNSCGFRQKAWRKILWTS